MALHVITVISTLTIGAYMGVFHEAKMRLLLCYKV